MENVKHKIVEENVERLFTDGKDDKRIHHFLFAFFQAVLKN